MKSQPITVLMSVYSGEKADRFDAALQSMADQTAPAAEWVVVEDGPLPEPLCAVRDRWMQAMGDHYVALRLPENVGLARALNEGLRHCKHQWVARMDTDDVATPDRFEKQMAFLAAHPEVGLIGGQVIEYDDDLVDVLGRRDVPLEDRPIRRFARFRNPFNHMTVMFRRDDVLKVGGYPEELRKMQDYGLWARLFMAGVIGANLPDVLAKVRAGRGMIERRTGNSYFRYEWLMFNAIRRSGFISSGQFVLSVGSRLVVRFMPARFIKAVYQGVLKRGV